MVDLNSRLNLASMYMPARSISEENKIMTTNQRKTACPMAGKLEKEFIEA